MVREEDRCELAHRADRSDRSVLYHRIPRLFAELALAHRDSSFHRLFRGLCKTNLLVLDDLGSEPLTSSQRRDVLEIIEEALRPGLDPHHQPVASRQLVRQLARCQEDLP